MRKEMIQAEQWAFELEFDRFSNRHFDTEADRYRAEKVLLQNHARKNPHLIWVMEDDWFTTIGERLDQIDELITQS